MPIENAEYQDNYQSGNVYHDASNIAKIGALGVGTIGSILTTGYALQSGMDKLNGIDISTDLSDLSGAGVSTVVGTLIFGGLHRFFAWRADRLQD